VALNEIVFLMVFENTCTPATFAGKKKRKQAKRAI